jgi:hypothetical protein
VWPAIHDVTQRRSVTAMPDSVQDVYAEFRAGSFENLVLKLGRGEPVTAMPDSVQDDLMQRSSAAISRSARRASGQIGRRRSRRFTEPLGGGADQFRSSTRSTSCLMQRSSAAISRRLAIASAE